MKSVRLNHTWRFCINPHKAPLLRIVALCFTLLIVLLPIPAVAHDLSRGKINVTLTSVATGHNEAIFTAEATTGIAAPQLKLAWKLFDDNGSVKIAEKDPNAVSPIMNSPALPNKG